MFTYLVQRYFLKKVYGSIRGKGGDVLVVVCGDAGAELEKYTRNECSFAKTVRIISLEEINQNMVTKYDNVVLIGENTHSKRVENI